MKRLYLSSLLAIVHSETLLVKCPARGYTLHMDIQEIKEKSAPVLRSHNVDRASVFGSSARGDANPRSDVDFLIRFKRAPGMIAYMQFVENLQDALQRPVDIVTEKSAQKHLLPHIKDDLTVIYES